MSKNNDFINNIEVGKRIREIRESNGLTQEQLAELLNVNTTAVRSYERGEYGISKDVMYLFRKHFKISVDYLLFGPNDDSDELILSVENASEPDKMKIFLKLLVYFVNEKKPSFTGNKNTDGIVDIIKSVFGE